MPAPHHARASVIAVLLALAALAACRTTEELEPSATGLLASAEPLGITLAPGLLSWKESPSSPGKRTRFRLGPLFARLFPAHDGRAFLSPVDANLESHWSGDARAWKSRYAFTLSLQLDGIRHEVHGVGHGQSEGDPRAAERDALESCVSDIYTNVSALLGRRGQS